VAPLKVLPEIILKNKEFERILRAQLLYSWRKFESGVDYD